MHHLIDYILNPQEIFSDLIEIKQTQSHGRGIFAKQNIPKHTLLICSKAIIYTANPTAEVVITQFNQIKPTLTQQQLSDYESLQKSHGTGITSAFETNAMLAIPNIKSPQVGLFLKFSFCNHSCCPNSVQTFNEDFVFLTTSKPIAQGEEITISYLQGANFWYLQGRQNYLKNYNFTCKCDLCEYQQQKEFIDTQIQFDKFLKQVRNKNAPNGVEIQIVIEKISNLKFSMVDGFFEVLIGAKNEQNFVTILDQVCGILEKLEVFHRPSGEVLMGVLLAVNEVAGGAVFERLKKLIYEFEMERFGCFQHFEERFQKEILEVGGFQV